MSHEQPLRERDRAWLEHIRNCDSGCLSTYAKTNDLDVQRLYAAESRLKTKGGLGGCPSKRLVWVKRHVAWSPSAKAFAGCTCATAWCSK